MIFDVRSVLILAFERNSKLRRKGLSGPTEMNATLDADIAKVMFRGLPALDPIDRPGVLGAARD